MQPDWQAVFMLQQVHMALHRPLQQGQLGSSSCLRQPGDQGRCCCVPFHIGKLLGWTSWSCRTLELMVFPISGRALRAGGAAAAVVRAGSRSTCS